MAKHLVIQEHQSQEHHITDYVFPPEEEIDIKDNTNDLLNTSVTQSGLSRYGQQIWEIKQNTSPEINHQYVQFMTVPLKLTKFARRYQSNVELQPLLYQILFKLFVSNFITTSTS